MFVLILVIIFLLALTAITAASEISIIAVSRLKLRRLAAGGSKPAKIILKILETPEKFFSTILVASNIVTTLIASIVTVMAIAIMGGEGKGIIAATIITSAIIIICEIIAKTFSAIHSEKVSLSLARPISNMITVFSPVIEALASITKFIIKIIGGQPIAKPALIAEEEIRALVNINSEDDAPHKEKYKMISRVFDFSDTIVKNVMTPKKDMVSIDIDADLDDILNKALESAYSRLPVYRDSPDNIIGLINMKDLLGLSFNRSLIVLQDIVYPATFVSGSKKVTELLREFQKGHTHLAVVKDEQDKIEGIITLEDLLEEIVGEIEDEYDIRSRRHKKSK